MKRVQNPLVTIVAFVVLCGASPARTWHVGGPGADFDQIQPAIDAASPGDLIFVTPNGTYDGFTLNKGLTVRSASGRFRAEWASIRKVPAYETACLGGFEMVYDGRLSIEECEGTVLIEDGLVIRHYEIWESYPIVRVEICPFVFFTDVEIEGRYSDTSLPEPALRIQNALVVLSDVRVKGCQGEQSWNPWVKAGPGGPGVGVREFARVVLARVQIEGGKGGKGAPGDIVGNTGEGGDGGAGLVVENSEVMVLGCCGDFIKGGDGGNGGDDWGANQGEGGDGGPGLVGSGVVVSGVALLGGEGGLGRPNGQDGLPYEGDPIFVDPPYPVLDMEGDIHPGSSFDVTIHGQSGDAVIMLLSDSPGWLDAPGGLGPPLVAQPGAWFIAFYAGAIDPLGELRVSLTMMADPIVQGFALTGQAAVLPGDQTFVLSNAAARIVGE